MQLRWAYDLLEVNPGARRAQVRAAYWNLARRWHPDRLQADQLRALQGAERLKQINVAYAAIRDAGFPRPPPPAPPSPPPSPRPASAAAEWAPPAAAPPPPPRPSTPPPARAGGASILWSLFVLVLFFVTLGLLNGGDNDGYDSDDYE